MQAPHVLILGCGRSGTSIFGELFEHLPPYQYRSEPAFAEVMQMDFSTPIALKVPKESPDFAPDPGLSFPIDLFLKKAGQALQCYWIVRHPLDTIYSLKVGISRNWGHHPKPPDWQEWLSRPLLERCAHHWRYLNTVGYDRVKHLVQVKYFEELVLYPERFATSICQDLGLDLQANVEELQSWTDRVQNTNNQKFKEAKTSSAYSTQDHKVKVGRWKENASSEEVDLLWPMVEDVADRFGYTL